MWGNLEEDFVSFNGFYGHFVFFFIVSGSYWKEYITISSYSGSIFWFEQEKARLQIFDTWFKVLKLIDMLVHLQNGSTDVF